MHELEVELSKSLLTFQDQGAKQANERTTLEIQFKSTHDKAQAQQKQPGRREGK